MKNLLVFFLQHHEYLAYNYVSLQRPHMEGDRAIIYHASPLREGSRGEKKVDVNINWEADPSLEVD